jgi:hypothetical protein
MPWFHGKLKQSRCDVFQDTPSGMIGQFLGVVVSNADYKLVDDGLYECFHWPVNVGNACGSDGPGGGERRVLPCLYGGNG